MRGAGAAAPTPLAVAIVASFGAFPGKTAVTCELGSGVIALPGTVGHVRCEP